MEIETPSSGLILPMVGADTSVSMVVHLPHIIAIENHVSNVRTVVLSLNIFDYGDDRYFSCRKQG